jgi:hypothetical protein
MTYSLLATFITGLWLFLTILLSISLADILPPEFMNRDYTGAFTKPKRTAQIAFLSIGGTFLAAFFVWTATPFISHYYDYVSASLLRLFAVWWFLVLVITAIIRQFPKHKGTVRWIVTIVMVAVVSIVFLAPITNNIAIGFLAKPYPLTGIVAEKNADMSKYGAYYSIAIDTNVYNVTRIAYSDLQVGETANLVRTEFNHMAFPIHHVKLTWIGALLLLLNLLIIASVIMIIGNRFISEVEGS